MTNLLKRLAKLPSRFAASIFNREPDTRKDARHLKFSGGDETGRESVRQAFEDAAKMLRQKNLIKNSKHRIRRITFVPGGRYTPQSEWGFFDSASGQFVAGLCGGREIQLAVNPETRRMNHKRGFRDARHEWGHALLAVAHPNWTTEQHHKEMGF